MPKARAILAYAHLIFFFLSVVQGQLPGLRTAGI
jgi:hypothetical protein